MKKYSLLFCLFALLSLAACNKDPECADVTYSAPESEVTTLQNYITTNNIDATADSRGFYYKISNAGDDKKPNPCSYITINYTGKLTNGNMFDSGSGVSFSLSNLIYGWREGLPLIGKGGVITLYLPPSLAYGNKDVNDGNGAIIIPANSILVFEVKLLDF